VIKTTTEKRSGPSNVTGSAASDYIKLRWDNADNADIYRIYCREDGENEYTMIGKAIKNDYTARKLKSDTTYHFKVESLTKNGSKYVIQGISSELTVRTKLPDFLKVPDFTITDVDGKEYLITEFADKPMVIFFWVKDNNDVDRYLAYLDTLYKKYGDSVDFIMINCDHKSLIKNVKEYIAAQNLSMNIYFDWTLDGLSKQGTNITPYLFSVNANGELAKKFTGTLNNEAILKTVEKALQ
jgi:cytochrome oxidase Cu insertion factor (SCO1/SenC/PrrC family)